MHLSLPGVRVPHRKNTADSVPVRITTPRLVTIPMSMHIGAPAVPVVKPGDRVETGQLIAEAGGFVSSPVYASITGTVTKIEPIITPLGQSVPSITITAGEEQKIAETVKPPVVENAGQFTDAVRNSGVVGLGGAGFPTAVKIPMKDLSAIREVVINGAECEPYITSDTQTMMQDTALLAEGIAMLEKYLGVKKVLFAIERNKPQCIARVSAALKDDENVRVVSLPSLYPQGGEKVLIYHTTGKTVPEGKLPIDVGVVVFNCTTLAAIARYVKTGMPLIEKYVTVDGPAVKHPQNVIAPIGTPMQDVFDFCGGFSEEPKKLLYGGPMMGTAVSDLSAPVLKNTNALLAFGARDVAPAEETACLRCGRCVSHCPLHLRPCEIERAYQMGHTAELEKLKVNICMECGCCSYICPAGRPLVQTNKLAKALLRDVQSAKKAKEGKKS